MSSVLENWQKLRWIFVLSLGITLALTPQLASAQSCYERCQNSCKNMSGIVNQGCVDNCNRANCENRNTNQPKPFGAIAFGDQAFEGISWNKGTQAEADQAALASCSKNGKNCKIVYRYRDTCAALAVAAGRLHYESATGKSEKDAEANATAVCEQKWGSCKSNLSACSLTGSSH
jgi:hypothetical protein